MRRIVAGLILACLLAACRAGPPINPAPAPAFATATRRPAVPPSPAPTAPPATATLPPGSRVDVLLSHMDIEQKVGQILVVAFDGTEAGPDARRFVQEFHVGGFVYLAGNVNDPAQLARLSTDLQGLARTAGLPGLILCTDQEGGPVARLRESQGFTEFPGAMALGATGDPENARLLGQAMAEEMRAVGINVNLAPDLDVNSNPANPIIGLRSFGSDPALVSRFGLAYMEGLQRAGVAAVGKHFPGHGDAGVDSHVALPVVARDRAGLDAVELAPFRAASAAGIAGIMSAHIAFPALEPTPGLAATLSPQIMTDLLRGSLGYRGLVMTDALEMGALTASGFPPPAAAAAALAAGADVLLMGHEPEVERQAYYRVLAEVRTGRIPMSRLDDAVRHVLLLKEHFGILDPAPVDPSAAAGHVGTPDHHALARSLAARAITIVRDNRQAPLLPLAPNANPLVIEPSSAAGLAPLLGGTLLRVGTQPTGGQIAQAQRRSQGGGPVIVVTADVAQNPGQADLIQALMAAGVRPIVVAVRSPYDLLSLRNVPTFVASFGDAPPQLAALAALLRGEARPQGRLPVDLPGQATLGQPSLTWPAPDWP